MRVNRVQYLVFALQHGGWSRTTYVFRGYIEMRKGTALEKFYISPGGSLRFGRDYYRSVSYRKYALRDELIALGEKLVKQQKREKEQSLIHAKAEQMRD